MLATRADWTQLGQLVAFVLMLVPLWLAVSLRLPHGAARGTALLPGAILVAIGFQVTHGLVVYQWKFGERPRAIRTRPGPRRVIECIRLDCARGRGLAEIARQLNDG